jgi:hypothetical protein
LKQAPNNLTQRALAVPARINHKQDQPESRFNGSYQGGYRRRSRAFSNAVNSAEPEEKPLVNEASRRRFCFNQDRGAWLKDGLKLHSGLAFALTIAVL